MRNDPPLIVVAGRNNFREHSTSLNVLIEDLERAGYEVCRLETRNTETARWLDVRASRLLGHDATVGTAATRAAKLLALLGRPSRWDYVLRFVEAPNNAAARDLRRLIRRLAGRRVNLVAHSAGGIVATMVAAEPAVATIVCFGYPFRHPGQPEEPRRTAHLRTVTKPLLIIQGDQDDYGTAEDAGRYVLSPSTTVARVAAEHGYDNLDPGEYARCRALVLDFLSRRRNG